MKLKSLGFILLVWLCVGSVDTVAAQDSTANAPKKKTEETKKTVDPKPAIIKDGKPEKPEKVEAVKPGNYLKLQLENRLVPDLFPRKLERFVDKDGDGYNDAAPDHDHDGIPDVLDKDFWNLKRNDKPKFVDRDGDGINDSLSLGQTTIKIQPKNPQGHHGGSIRNEVEPKRGSARPRGRN